jgi:hypothetical protein
VIARAGLLVAVVVVVAGCGGGGGARPATTTTAGAVAAGPAVSPHAPAPAGYRFRSPRRYGYWFTRPPVVVVPKVGNFQHSFVVFLRLNRRLAHYRAKQDGRIRHYRIDAGVTVDGADVSHGASEVDELTPPRPCYREVLPGPGRRRADDVAVGELVTVVLRIADHPQPLTVRVPLGVSSGDDNDPLGEVYRARIGCADA